ncbi:MAG: DNA polymerase I [Actinomycetes bacterium]
MPVTRATAPPIDAPRRLLLLDGHSLAYRAFYALPVENFSTTTGQPTNAVYGFTSMLINLLRDETPTHLAVAFDVSRQTFRSVEFAAYKAHRVASPEAFGPQVGLIKEVLAALAVPVVQADGFEADDVLATLATRAEAAGYDVAICTGDRDAYQLVDEHITVLYPRKGVSDLARMTPAAVVERYGLTPTQYPDFAALRGDPSDNLPGIPGVGEKTATRWIVEYGSLDELVARVDEVRGKTGDALRAHLADVLRNRTLTQLVRDLELPVEVDDLARHPADLPAVDQLFDTLQFRALRSRLSGLRAALPAGAGDGPAGDGAVTGSGRALQVVAVRPGGLDDWLTDHARDGRRVGLAVTGTLTPARPDLTGIALASCDGSATWLDPAELDPRDEATLGAWLTDARWTKAAHDAKPALLGLWARGLDLDGLTSDTALAAYLVLPGQRATLGDLSQRFLGHDLHSAEPDGVAPVPDQLDLGLATPAELAREAHQTMLAAQTIAELADVLDAELASRESAGLLTDLELPLFRVLARMEATGIAVDHPELVALEEHFAGLVKASAQEAYQVLGHEVNLGSPKQLQAVLFDELGMPKTKRIKTGYTTDADALADLYTRTSHPFLEHLLRHRDVARLRVTVEGLLRAVADDGRIHTTFQQTVAATGRLSSTDPNLQNIPVRTEEGRRIREAFVVGAGYQSLLTADYAQIELRIMAHLSGDDGLRAAFTAGEDLHITMAAQVFGVPADQVDPERRRRIKAMSYGLAYGLSTYGLAQQLGISADEARRLMEEYYARFGGIRDYLASLVERARETGYTETLLGRRRYLPDLTSDNRQRREMAERMALNAPIQGSAADIIKVAMLGMDGRLRQSGLESRLLLQVHDEVVVEVAPGEQEPVEQLVREAMSSAVELSVPLDVSVGVGRTWAQAAH